MPTFEQINLFYVALAVVCIPMLVGFFAEAGKDIYNKIRKRPSPEDIRTELDKARADFIEMCKQNRQNCLSRDHIITDVKKLKDDHEYFSERQRVLREERLPRIETTLEGLKSDVKEVGVKVETLSKELKDDIQRLFDLWDGMKKA